MAKVKLDYAGFREVRRSAAPIVTELAEDIAARANSMAVTKGARYEAAPAKGTEAGCVALATTGHGDKANGYAAYDNYAHNTLLKAMG